jgi:glycosyltransferase involved in cell wall biosynthesis
LSFTLCVIVDDYPSTGRPVFIFVEQLVNAFVDQGIPVSVVAPQSLTRALFRRVPIMPKVEDYSTPSGNRYKVYRPYSISFGNHKLLLGKMINAYNQYNVNRVLKHISPDVLYGHFWHSAMKLLSYAKKYNRPLFVACGEGDDALENLVSRLTIDEKHDLTGAVKGVISVSSENKRKCLHYGLCKEQNIIVLPNGVDQNLFHPFDSSDIRKKLGLSEQDFTLVFTGAFIHRKGSSRLAEAINLLHDKQIKVLFIGKPLAGDDATPECEGLLFRGTVDHKELPKYLNAADVFVLPTLKEGCSNAIVEALACGLPVISSNKPFNDDILNEHNSLLVDPEDVSELAAAIKAMKSNSLLFKSKKEYVLNNANNFSIIGRAQQILTFINNKIRS